MSDGDKLSDAPSAKDGLGWTTIAIDRPTRELSIAHRRRQSDAAKAACANLYV